MLAIVFFLYPLPASFIVSATFICHNCGFVFTDGVGFENGWAWKIAQHTIAYARNTVRVHLSAVDGFAIGRCLKY